LVAYDDDRRERFLVWARERRAAFVTVSAYAANEAAQRFYRRHGFVPKSITLQTDL
jgi:ribosomal protein S18 acetylase RimI-like enzyme